MASKTSICNIAVSRLGQTQITSLTDNTDKKARLCNVFFDHLRDTLLQEQWWSFATKRETLSQLVATPDSEFDYYYQLPSDCITPRYLVDDTIEYRIEGDRLATDESTASNVELVYTKRETDTAKFTAHFSDLLAYRIALELVIPLKIDNATRDRVQQDYLLAMRRYSQIDKRRGNKAQQRTSRWVDIRKGGASDITQSKLTSEV